MTPTKNAMEYGFFATSVRFVEDLLAEELRGLGAASVSEKRAGVGFSGTLETAYRACLWSRLASRILLTLRSYPAGSPDALYTGAAAVDWSDHLSAESTVAVDCSLASSSIRHSGYAAQVVKDAVVDHFRRRCGRRPSVSVRRPDVRLNLRLAGDRAVLSLDLSGESLHRRAYRSEAVEAPLKENIAAALLLRAGWPRIAEGGGGFIDPMCGSGTLPIEAALMAADCPPGLLRTYFGFLGWKGHDAGIWKALLDEGRRRFAAGRSALPLIVGYDRDAGAVHAAGTNLRNAGLDGFVRIERRELDRAEPPEGTRGLLAVNPPYGERLEAGSDLPALYRSLGRILKKRFDGWKAAVLTGHAELARSVGLRASRLHTLYNGTIRCTLAHFEIEGENRLRDPAPGESGRAETPDREGTGEHASGGRDSPLSPGAGMLANRLRKNRRHLRRWLRNEGVTCYRIYDADLPEYAVSIDLYEDRWAHLQEYAPPASVDPESRRRHLEEILAVVPDVLGIDEEAVYVKTRRRQRGNRQYAKLDGTGAFHPVREGDCRFLVNFSDYLDTGLFLDHRITRKMIGEMAGGRRFLNLFCYTGTATVYAAKGGAAATTSVDGSAVYLSWAQKNLALNGISGSHNELIRADCLDWLRRERGKYGLIFLDPPTFSNSKSRKQDFVVQRDHGELIDLAACLLEPDGVLLFSCNYRRFELGALAGLVAEDLSEATHSPDFSRRRVHRCWKIMRDSGPP